MCKKTDKELVLLLTLGALVCVVLAACLAIKAILLWSASSIMYAGTACLGVGVAGTLAKGAVKELRKSKKFVR